MLGHTCIALSGQSLFEDLDLDVLLCEHASADTGIDTLSQLLASFCSIAVTKDAHDERETIEAADDGKQCLIAWIILNVEARLEHEAVGNNRCVGAATSFETKPRVLVVTRLTTWTTRAKTSTTDIWLMCQIEEFRTLLVGEAAWAPEAIATSTWLFGGGAHHLHLPPASQHRIDFWLHRHGWREF